MQYNLTLKMDEIILKNPITDHIKNAVNNSRNKLNFAVPFLNSFACKLLHNSVQDVLDKRIITRFDPSCLISFDIPVLEKLIAMGFKIRYDNNIHLKVYITDSETFVSSSNLTKGGFESNVELTIKVDSENTEQCNSIFEEIWQNTQAEVTSELLKDNYAKYYLLKKKDDFANNKKSSDINIITVKGGIDTQKIIDEIFNLGEDYAHLRELTYSANQKKEIFKNKLKTGFNKNLFYVPEGHRLRLDNLFYDFTYGIESKIAGTGLRELQFSTVFEHPEFQKVIEYIYPEMSGMKPWNLSDKEELYEFCCGIFDFKIPQYTEVLPIRLASYFYPEYFMPIFKLQDLYKACDLLKLETNAKSKGERLYAYSTHIRDQMSNVPYDNNFKFNFAYIIIHTFELYDRMEKGEHYNDIISNSDKKWKERYLNQGLKVLQKLDFANMKKEKNISIQ